MIKVLAISHAYVEPYTRIGLINPEKYPEIDFTVILPKYMAKKYPKGYRMLIEEKYKVKLINSFFNFHHSVRIYSISIFFFILNLRPDIIFILNEPWSSTAFQIVLFCKIFFNKTKVIVYTLENLNRKYPLPFRWWEKFVLKNVDLVITGTKKDGEIVLRKKGYKGKIEYVPLGVNTKIFKKMDASSLRKLIAGDVPFVIGYVGRLVKEKGIEILIRAVKILEFKFHLLVIGEGPLKKKLVDLVKELDLCSKVTFLGGIFYPELPKFINCLDVLVLPSITTSNWKEQFGRVLVESMSCEVPVIASSSGECPYVIGDAGLIFQENDYVDLANKLTLLLDKSLKNELIKKGVLRVKENFSTEKIEKVLLNIYKKVLVK